MSQGPIAPAGWYLDPTGRPVQRYWDGAAWTDAVRALPPPTQPPGAIAPVPSPVAGAASPLAPRNGMGTASLVLGIISLFGGCIFAILAIVFGKIGINRAARGEATNRAMAVWGQSLGAVSLVIWFVVGVLVALGNVHVQY